MYICITVQICNVVSDCGFRFCGFCTDANKRLLSSPVLHGMNMSHLMQCMCIMYIHNYYKCV